MRCRTDLSVNVAWLYGEVKQYITVSVYDGGRIVGKYHHERFSVNSSQGWYNLTIQNVTFRDAGVYACSDNDNERGSDKGFVDLLVIGE